MRGKYRGYGGGAGETVTPSAGGWRLGFQGEMGRDGDGKDEQAISYFSLYRNEFVTGI
jgi:hypothetical protein